MNLAALDNLQGDTFLRHTWEKEDLCEQNTDKALSELGRKAPHLLPAISRSLVYLEGVASCLFGCAGGDHALERLLFRSCNRSRASIRLARLGFYDESLLLVRAIGETTNLLTLFKADTASLQAWRDANGWTTKPVKIRCKLEELGEVIPMDEERYSLLSGLAAHNDPAHIPAAYNVLRRPVAPGTLFPEGLLLCLNELARQVAFSSLAASSCFSIPTDARLGVLKSGRDLTEQIGGFTIDIQPEYWNRLRSEIEASRTDPQSSDGGAGQMRTAVKRPKPAVQ